MRPLISIIIPTYNRADLIGETIDSVLHQSFDDWECLIIDDGSTDDTAEIVSTYADERIRYFYRTHEERSRARNFGLSKARGKFIQFLDSDDLLDKRKFQLSMDFLTNDISKRSVVVTDFRTFTNSIEFSSHPYSRLSLDQFHFSKFLFEWGNTFTIPIHCGLFQRDLVESFKFPENLTQWEDWFLWLHVFKQKNISTFFVDEPLAFCRILSGVKETKISDKIKSEEDAIENLRKIIPEKDRAEFYLTLIRRKNAQIIQLSNNIQNYRKSRTFIISERIKKTFGL